MNMVLYKTSDSDNVINKTLTNSKTINIKLKNDVDILQPELVIKNGDSLNINDYNYLELVELNRLYFIRNTVSLGNGLFRVFCECDFIETYKVEVMNSSARFNRKFKTGDYFKASSIDVSNIKTIETYFSGVSISETPSMILTTVGEL